MFKLYHDVWTIFAKMGLSLNFEKHNSSFSLETFLNLRDAVSLMKCTYSLFIGRNVFSIMQSYILQV